MLWRGSKVKMDVVPWPLRICRGVALSQVLVRFKTSHEVVSFNHHSISNSFTQEWNPAPEHAQLDNSMCSIFTLDDKWHQKSPKPFPLCRVHTK